VILKRRVTHVIASPGTITFRGAIRIYGSPELIIEPHSGIAGGIPTPRNERVAMVRIA
jgi:hypothetical protein